SVNMKVINNLDVSENGNDLVLDDIKIMACAPPAIDLFFDETTLSKEEEVCDEQFNLVSVASTMLVKYYANSPLYLYQWTKTPNDNTSWKNVGNPQTLATFNFTNPTAHAASSRLNSGDKLYFRVIAGTSSVFTSFNNFTAPHYANSNDPCKNY